MSKFWQTKSFREQEAEWNERLKESGFVDAEKQVSADTRFLIQSAASPLRSSAGSRPHKGEALIHSLTRAVTRFAVQSYYEQVSRQMDYAPPKRRIDRIVMFYVSHGAQIKEIAGYLKELGLPCHRQTVSFIIRKYEHLWGIRAWNEKSLNPSWRTARIKF